MTGRPVVPVPRGGNAPSSSPDHLIGDGAFDHDGRTDVRRLPGGAGGTVITHDLEAATAPEETR